MKRIILLTMAFVTMLGSLGGCYWGFEGPGRGGGYERDEGHDDRGGGRDRGGDREERH